jgi:hypothetical protein
LLLVLDKASRFSIAGRIIAGQIEMLCEIFEFFFPRQVILSSLKKRTVTLWSSCQHGKMLVKFPEIYLKNRPKQPKVKTQSQNAKTFSYYSNQNQNVLSISTIVGNFPQQSLLLLLLRRRQSHGV